MNSTRKILAGLALSGAAMTGGIVGASLIGTAGAQTNDTTSTTVAQAPAQSNGSSTNQAPPSGAPSGQPGGPRGQHDESKGGHMANGITETLLTGDSATKAKAAAEAAVPGGTVLRVENDAEGATYEAHVQKSDGSQVTVKMDASYKVTSTEDGPR